MASENETVEDIVKEMHRLSRATNRNGLNVKDDPLRTVRKSASAAVHMFANRIEAAHRREKADREFIDSNAHTITADSTTYDEHCGVNAIVIEWRERPISVHTEPEESARLDKLHNAYYAEMRNVAELRDCLKMAIVDMRIAKTCVAFGRECDTCKQVCDAHKWSNALKWGNDAGK